MSGRRARSLLLAASILVLALAASAAAATLIRDRTFSGDGSKLVGFSRVCCAEPFALSIDGRGRIITAGTATTGPGHSEVAVARLLPDGRPDTRFSGDGRVTINLYSRENAYEAALSAIPAGGGRLLVGGIGGNSGYLLRMTARGRIDRTFSGDGMRWLGSGSVDSLAPGPAGSVYVARQNRGSNRLMRIDGDGRTDYGFGEQGVAAVDFGPRPAGSPILRAMPDGRILLATTYGAPNSDRRLGVARFLPNGDPDETFAGDGTTLIDLPSRSEVAGGVGIDESGRITVIAGTFDGEVGLARLTPSGTPDPEFGEAGEVVVRYDERARFRLGGGTVFPSGAVIVGGSLHNRTSGVALARFRPDGTLSPGFGDAGWKLMRPKQRLFAPLLALQADRKPVFATAEPYGIEGRSVAGFRLLRFLAR